jgi:hypothetical protein
MHDQFAFGHLDQYFVFVVIVGAGGLAGLDQVGIDLGDGPVQGFFPSPSS